MLTCSNRHASSSSINKNRKGARKAILSRNRKVLLERRAVHLGKNLMRTGHYRIMRGETPKHFHKTFRAS